VGLTQIEMSDNAKITQGQISGIERGDRVLHWSCAARMTPALEDVYADELFINQNLYAGAEKISEAQKELDVLEVEVDEFEGWKNFSDPRARKQQFQKGVTLNSKIIEVGTEIRTRLNSIHQAFGKFWLSTGKMKGEEGLKELIAQGQDTVGEALAIIKKLGIDPDFIHRFRSNQDEIDDAKVQYEAKNLSNKLLNPEDKDSASGSD